jgi:hypothetical protein
MKIAYDLDGVLVPDCDHIPNLGQVKELYELLVYMRPTFIPRGDWSIVTARPQEYFYLTEQWIARHFTEYRPQLFQIMTREQRPETYKLAMINSLALDVYVESDPKIVAYLRNHTAIKVIWFGDWIGEKLGEFGQNNA